MSMVGVVQPCNKSGATIDLSVTDTKFNVSYAFPQFDANTNGSIPVPGKALFFLCRRKKSTACLTPSQESRSPRPSAPPESMPITTRNGDVSEVTFGLNVDLCVVSTFYTTCASKMGVPGMPVTLISGTYDFSALCS